MDVGEETLRRISRMDNFNREQSRKILKHAGDRVLEVGCGIGNISQFFTDRTLFVGIDVNSLQIEKIKSKFKHRKNMFFYKKDITEKIDEFKKHNFDTIICLNVLEHIKDDRKALKNMHDILCENGKLILLVPLHVWLYGSIDKLVGHHRRYKKNEITEKLLQTRFKTEKTFCQNFFGIFGWFLNSKILKRDILPAKQLKFFDKLQPLFGIFEKMFPFLPGLSLCCICTKIGKNRK